MSPSRILKSPPITIIRLIIFNGLDEEHNASNIIFKNITLNGKALTKKDDFNISSNQFVDFKIS